MAVLTMLEVVLRQTAGDLLASGNTNPTEQDFRNAFLVRLNRNRELCERFITEQAFQDHVTHVIAREVWTEIRKGEKTNG